MKIINHFRELRTNNKNRLALEIGAILIIKIFLLWLIWTLCFSHPIAKNARQQAVTRMILNQIN